MKAIFGLMAIVVVLAVVANLARKNLGAAAGPGTVATRESDAVREASRQAGVPPSGGSRLDAFPGAVVADPTGSVPQVSQGMQQRAVQRTTQALQQGTERNERAAP